MELTEKYETQSNKLHLTLADAFNDARPVKEIPTEILKQQLSLFVQHKCWGSSRFYTVRDEVQRRATAAWVREDVFGHTFTGSAK